MGFILLFALLFNKVVCSYSLPNVLKIEPKIRGISFLADNLRAQYIYKKKLLQYMKKKTKVKFGDSKPGQKVEDLSKLLKEIQTRVSRSWQL